MTISHRRGCLARAASALIIMFGCTLGSCATWLLIYALFPPSQSNILVMGLDSRDGEGYVTRSDSILVIGVNPEETGVALLSIPRDLFISVPEYGLERINTVNMLGELESPGYGPELLKDSLSLSFGITIDSYVRLDFRAFEAMIDAVNGIDVDVSYTIIDNAYPTDDYGTRTVRFDPGMQHMDGATALVYARTRHSDDDYRRAERQQQILQAFTDKLINPLYWPGVLNAIQSHVNGDLSVIDMIQTAPALLLSAGQFEQLVIDRDYIRPGEYGATPDYPRLSSWLDRWLR
jgi:LCP family protein required for cell wall assembly